MKARWILLALVAALATGSSVKAAVWGTLEYDLNISNEFTSTTNVSWGSVKLQFDDATNELIFTIASTYPYTATNDPDFDGFGFNTDLAVTPDDISGDLGSGAANWNTNGQLDGFGKFTLANGADTPKSPSPIQVIVDLTSVIGSTVINSDASADAYLALHFAQPNTQGKYFAAHYILGVDNTIDGENAGSHWISSDGSLIERAPPGLPEPTSLAAWLLGSAGLGLILRGRMKKAAA